jgi:membrane protein DedA with SNARE-associated domain
LFIAVMLGSFAGESLGFYIGRIFGPRIRSSKLGLRIPEKVWNRADTFVESRGGIAIAMSRFLPVLHSVVPLTAGMTKMKYKTFIAWTAGACAVWTSIYLGIGWFAHGATDALKQFKFGGAIFAGIIVVFLIIVTLAKKRLEKSATAMIEESEEAKARAKKLREAEMKRPNA